jgi:peptidoglycan/xylan/chitin deacetylase (PgdA/CDA1 family)
MIDARRRATLRRMTRPPFVQRWAALVGTTTVVAVLAGSCLARAAGDGTGTADVPEAALQAAPAAVAPTVRTTTEAGGRTVALTFDDGPDPVSTPQILDLLARHDARATFCVVTNTAMEHWRLVRRVVDEGHQLCDHTSAHDPGLARAEPADVARAMRLSGAELAAAAGDPDRPATLFRAPQGIWSPGLEQGAAAAGMRPLGWSVDPRDWTGAPAATVVAAVQRDLRDGGVVLLHDGGGERGETVAALRELLPWLREQGYRTVLPEEPAAPGAGSPEPGGQR